MMRVSHKLLKILVDSIDRGWFTPDEVTGLIGNSDETVKTLIEGYCLGLYSLSDGERFEIRREGLEIINIWRALGEPDAEPWIDSRVYMMIGVLSRRERPPPESWINILG